MSGPKLVNPEDRELLLVSVEAEGVVDPESMIGPTTIESDDQESSGGSLSTALQLKVQLMSSQLLMLCQSVEALDCGRVWKLRGVISKDNFILLLKAATKDKLCVDVGLLTNETEEVMLLKAASLKEFNTNEISAGVVSVTLCLMVE